MAAESTTYIKAEGASSSTEMIPPPRPFYQHKDQADPEGTEMTVALAPASILIATGITRLPPSPRSLSPSPPSSNKQELFPPFIWNLADYTLDEEDTRRGQQALVAKETAALEMPPTKAIKEEPGCETQDSQLRPTLTNATRKDKDIPSEFSPASHLSLLATRSRSSTPKPSTPKPPTTKLSQSSSHCTSNSCASEREKLRAKLKSVTAAFNKLQAEQEELQKSKDSNNAASKAEIEVWRNKYEVELKINGAMREEKEKKERIIVDRDIRISTLRGDMTKKEKVIDGLWKKLDDERERYDSYRRKRDEEVANLRSKPAEGNTFAKVKQGALEAAAMRVANLLMDQRRGGMVDAASLSQKIQDTIIGYPPIKVTQNKGDFKSHTPPPPPPSDEKSLPPPPPPPSTKSEPPPMPTGRRRIPFQLLLNSYLAKDGFLREHSKNRTNIDIPERPQSATEAFILLFAKYDASFQNVVEHAKTMLRPFTTVRYRGIAPFFGLSPEAAGSDIPELSIQASALPPATINRIAYDLESARTLYGDPWKSTTDDRSMESLFRELLILFKGSFKHKTGNPSYLPLLPADSPYVLHRFIYKDTITNIILLHYKKALSSPSEALPEFLGHASATAFCNMKTFTSASPSSIVGIITDSRTFTFINYNPSTSPTTKAVTWAPEVTGLSTVRSDSESIRKQRLESTIEYLFNAFLLAFLFAMHTTGESKDILEAAQCAHLRFVEAAGMEGTGPERATLISEALQMLEIAVEAVSLGESKIGAGVKRLVEVREEEAGRVKRSRSRS